MTKVSARDNAGKAMSDSEIDSFDIETVGTLASPRSTFQVIRFAGEDNVAIDIDNGDSFDTMTQEQFEAFVDKTRELMGWAKP